MFRLLARKPKVIERRVITLALGDGNEIEIDLLRHPRARRIKLLVDERGVRLTLPVRASERLALQFAGEHRDWLRTQLAALEVETRFDFRIAEGAALPLHGGSELLRWQPARLTRLVRDGDGLRFDVRGLDGLVGALPTPAVKRALRDFYEAEARADIARWLPLYSEGLPRLPARVVLKRLHAQWGSLTSRAVMTLDLALVIARPSAFEYVLVHELCHLLHHDHSRAFWREVEARCRHWRVERDYLHGEGRRLKATMRALAG
ncbi:MAG: SprT family zinc-dependent metalloprotease [Pseudomonadota bacterium]|nr:SprT family zinc-dependent metalloprotease [Pseudomonadota bacterium]